MDEQLERFISLATSHGLATEAGDSETANATHDELTAVLRGIQAEQGQQRLLDLLDHSNPSVRLWAAAECLDVDPAAAAKVLSEVSKQPGLVGLDAEMVLEEWRR